MANGRVTTAPTPASRVACGPPALSLALGPGAATPSIVLAGTTHPALQHRSTAARLPLSPPHTHTPQPAAISTACAPSPALSPPRPDVHCPPWRRLSSNGSRSSKRHSRNGAHPRQPPSASPPCPLVPPLTTRHRLNSKLKVREVEINDLITDLSDGVSRFFALSPFTCPSLLLRPPRLTPPLRLSSSTSLRSWATSPSADMPPAPSSACKSSRMSTSRWTSSRGGVFR